MIKKVSIKSAVDNKKVLAGLQVEPKLRVSLDTSFMAPDDVEKLDMKFREELGESYIAGKNSSDMISEDGVIKPRLEFKCLIDEKTPSLPQETISRIIKSFDELYNYGIEENGLLFIQKTIDFKFDALFEEENTVAAGVLLFGDKFEKLRNGNYAAREWFNICHFNPKNPNYGDRNEIKRYFETKSKHTKIKTEENAISEGNISVFGNFNYLLYRVVKIGEKQMYKNAKDLDAAPRELQMMHFIASTGFMLLEHETGVLKRVVFRTNEASPLQCLDMNTLANHFMKSWVEKKFTKGNNFLFNDEMEKISSVFKRETFITETDIENLITERNNRYNKGNRRGTTPENLTYNPFKDMGGGSEKAEKPKKGKSAKKSRVDEAIENGTGGVVDVGLQQEIEKAKVEEPTESGEQQATEEQPVEEEVV